MIRDPFTALDHLMGGEDLPETGGNGWVRAILVALVLGAVILARLCPALG